MKAGKFYLLAFFIISLSISSQESHPPPKQLPFHIDESRKIDPEELKTKKEDSFITGLPSVSSDPVTGVWYGVSAYYTDNGKKTNPLFAYSPYEYRVSLDYYQSSVGAKYYGLGIDLPYFKNTPYRFSTYGVYDRNLRALYFGTDASTLHPLSYHPRNDYSAPLERNADYSQREEALSYRRPGRNVNDPPYVTDKKYNEYDSEISWFTFNGDRTFSGAFRFAFGFDANRTIIRAYDGKSFKAKDPIFGDTDISLINVDIPTPNAKTKLTEDNEKNKLIGYKGGYTNYLKLGIAYDTRDFEPNPRKGTFSEINFVKVSRLWGSDYEFQRLFIHSKVYKQLFPGIFTEMIFAVRAGLTQIEGTIPFYEYRHIWSIDRSIFGLGGAQTLRGYKQDRFVSNVMGFTNVEIRYRFASFNIGEENFTLQIVPFIDNGRVWNNLNEINLKDYLYSKGLGLRIIWNQSTVILFDYAVSREDKQLFMNLGHAF